MPDEDLPMRGLGRLDQFAEGGVVGRDVAPAEQRHALALDLLGIEVADDLPPILIMRQEQHDDRVAAGLRKVEAERVAFLAKNLWGI